MDWQTGALGALFIYSAVITILYVRRSRRLKYRFRKALSRRVDVHRSALKTEDDARFQAAGLPPGAGPRHPWGSDEV